MVGTALYNRNTISHGLKMASDEKLTTAGTGDQKSEEQKLEDSTGSAENGDKPANDANEDNAAKTIQVSKPFQSLFAPANSRSHVAQLSRLQGS